MLLFVLVLAALVIVTVIALIKSLRARQAIADRTTTQDLAINLGAQGVSSARFSLRAQLTLEQVPQIAISVGPNGSFAQLGLTRADDSSAALPLPSVAWGANPLQLSTLGDVDDPFFGLAAVVIPTTASGVVDPTNGVTLADSSSASPISVRANVDYRIMPVSAWTLFSAESGVSLGMAGQASADVGRIFARGDVTVQGAVTTTYPLVCAGNVSVAASGSGTNALNVTASGRTAQVGDGQSTGSSTWVTQQTLTGSAGRAITTGRDLPVALSAVGSASTVFAASTDTNVTTLRYPTAATFAMIERDGVLSLLNETGQRAATGVVSLKTTPRYTAGPVIQVDAHALSVGSGSAVSLHITSSNGAAIVLVTSSSGSINAPISVSSDLPIYVEGNFNPRVASIVTSRGVRRVIGDF